MRGRMERSSQGSSALRRDPTAHPLSPIKSFGEGIMVQFAAAAPISIEMNLVEPFVLLLWMAKSADQSLRD